MRTASIIAGIFLGVAIGVGAYTFVYAKGASYMTDDPNACANCHVMNEQFDGWLKSSHRAVATCNDCHTPSGFVGKYATKASNGFWHSFAFTTGWFPDRIRIKESNRAVTQESCGKCHQELVDAIDGPHTGSNEHSCVSCHRSVGHLE